jgi:hypothetical protein
MMMSDDDDDDDDDVDVNDDDDDVDDVNDDDDDNDVSDDDDEGGSGMNVRTQRTGVNRYSTCRTVPDDRALPPSTLFSRTRHARGLVTAAQCLALKDLPIALNGHAHTIIVYCHST